MKHKTNYQFSNLPRLRNPKPSAVNQTQNGTKKPLPYYRPSVSLGLVSFSPGRFLVPFSVHKNPLFFFIKKREFLFNCYSSLSLLVFRSRWPGRNSKWGSCFLLISFWITFVVVARSWWSRRPALLALSASALSSVSTSVLSRALAYLLNLSKGGSITGCLPCSSRSTETFVENACCTAIFCRICSFSLASSALRMTLYGSVGRMYCLLWLLEKLLLLDFLFINSSSLEGSLGAKPKWLVNLRWTFLFPPSFSY